MEEVWSRPNRIGAVSLTSTISPTLLNEFNFSANSDGKGTIDFGSYCTACLRSTYGVNYPIAVSRAQRSLRKKCPASAFKD